VIALVAVTWMEDAIVSLIISQVHGKRCGQGRAGDFAGCMRVQLPLRSGGKHRIIFDINN
jgi:hypothetical protein